MKTIILGLILTFLVGTASACKGVIIGASNESTPDTARMTLDESLEATIPECEWVSYAYPGAYTEQFVQQAWNSQNENADVVIVGLTLQLFRDRAITLLQNVGRITLIHPDSKIYVAEYPEMLMRTLNPIWFVGNRFESGYELANLQAYNRHIGFLADRDPDVKPVQYPQYLTEWYVGGQNNNDIDGLHADTSTQMGLAQMIRLQLKQDGIIE